MTSTTIREEMPVRGENLSAAKLALLQKLRQGRAGESGMEPESIPRRGDGGPAPLSFAQQRLWFLHQLSSNEAAFNLPRFLRLRGRLDRAAFARAFGEIVRRHEVLRTAFLADDGPPVQRAGSEVSLNVPLIDLGALSLEEARAEAVRLALAEGRRPFDLTAAPLVRVQLLILGEDDHVLALTLHHIVADAWSFGVLMRELGLLYGAFARGEPSPLPELPLQYADFAVWQRRWLTGEVLDRQLVYWRERLQGSPPSLDLPTDRPRPPVSGFRGGSLEFTFSAELHDELKRLGSRDSVSIFMVLLAAFYVLLLRATGRTDLLVGTPIANRRWREIEGLIGFFVNTLVLRTDLSGDLTFREAVRRVREVSLEAYAHQDLPFERLVEELAIEREVNRPPVVQVMFVHQNIPSEGAALPGLELGGLGVEGGSTTFDLTLVMQAYGPGMIGWFEYNVDLFDRSTIRRLLGHFQHLLLEALAEPDRLVSELSWLSEAERAQLLTEWNDTACPAPVVDCVHHRVAAQALRQPRAVAVRGPGGCMSYQELDERAARLARELRRLGVGLERPVAVAIGRSPELLVALLGVWKAGGVFVPLDPAHPRERSERLLAETGAQVLLTASPLPFELRGPGLHEIDLTRLAPERPGDGVAMAAAEPDPANLAYVIYTSGSTGGPKGVMVEHGSLMGYLGWVGRTLGPGRAFRVPALTRPTFDACWKQILAPLMAGGEVWFLAEETAADPAGLLRELGEPPGAGLPAALNAVPSFWRVLLDAMEAGQAPVPAGLGALWLGGEALDAELADRTFALLPGVRLWNLYGPTEATANALASPVEPGAPGAPRQAPSLGRPLDGGRAYVADASLRPLPIGVPGELLLGGPGVARGYLGRPDLTAAAFVPDPFSGETGSRLYRTGDRMRRLGDGRLEFLGRIDEQVKIRGFRVEPGEIEAALRLCAGVEDAVVIAWRQGAGDHRLAAYVAVAAAVAAAAAPRPSEAGLRAALGELLPAYMIPATFELLDRLPVGPTGKVDRRALSVPSGERPEAAEDRVLPQTELERTLAGVWCEVLGTSEVGVFENFFDIGGNSLLLIQVYTRLGRRFPGALTIVDMLRNPTVGSLAKHLGGEGAAGAAGRADEAAPDDLHERAQAGRKRMLEQRARQRR